MRSYTVFALLAVAGCNRSPVQGDDSADSDMTPAPDMGMDDESDTGPEPDLPVEPGPCDTFVGNGYDCPAGFKCMAYWDNDLHEACFEVADEPLGLNEPCEDDDIWDGLDQCDADLACRPHPWTGDLVCLGYCVGVSEFGCADDTAMCQLTANAQGDVCLPNCDPLEDQCPDGSSCFTSIESNVLFMCLPTNDGGTAIHGEACEGREDCATGHDCSWAADVPDCGDERCCSALCDLDGPNDCPSMGQSCQPLSWGGEGQIQKPPILEHIGVCGMG